MDNLWEIKEPVCDDDVFGTQGLQLPSIILQILYARGITTHDAMQKYLHGTLDDEYDPFLLKGMDKAVARIHEAIRNGEGILVHGDYDVDGVTATAVMGKALDELGAQKYLYLPERLKGGYGVSKKAIYYAREKKAKLIITVDCGISAYEEARLARDFNIELIVTDHHRPSQDDLPDAYAIVDPWQDGCEYPFKELSGVGIAYKLVSALGIKDREAYLDLVAFGTVCDLSILTDENRLLVKKGLEIMDKGTNCGMKSLKKISGIRGKKANTGHLGFMYGPRVNASGRLGSADCALQLLITNNPREAESLANVLDAENKERQKLEQLIVKEAIRKVEQDIDFTKDKIIVVWNSSWHLGVIGIVAQRLVERYNMPAIVISVDKATKSGRGSARSVKGFNIFQALTETRDHLIEFGGHEYAAGVEIAVEKLEAFRKRINEYAFEKQGDAPFVKTFSIDAEIALSDIDDALLNSLESLEPYGRGNTKPVFCGRNLMCKERSIFLSKNTVKLWVTDGFCTYEALWYKAPVDTKISKGASLDILFNLARRKWHNRDVIVMEVKDLRILS